MCAATGTLAIVQGRELVSLQGKKSFLTWWSQAAAVFMFLSLLSHSSEAFQTTISL